MAHDIDIIFKGTTYQIVALSEHGWKWMADEDVGQIIPTVGINKLHRRMIDAGLSVLIGGQERKRGCALQERAESPDEQVASALRTASVVANSLWHTNGTRRR